MYKYKDRNLVSQSANTRCQNLLKKVMKQMDASVAKYRWGQQAVAELSEAVGRFTGRLGYSVWRMLTSILSETSMMLTWMAERRQRTQDTRSQA